jgi:hypothetical protein
MSKELKRLISLAECKHLSKTDRDALLWAVQNLSPEEAPTETSFDGWDFSQWPSVPDKALFCELIKSRKAKKKVIMTQSYINSAAPHLHELSKAGVTVNQALSVASSFGWQGFRASWVTNELQSEQVDLNNLNGKAPNEIMTLIKSGQITNFNDVPRSVREMIITQYRIGKLKPETMTLLESIGLVI